MPAPSESAQSPNLLGKFVSIVGLVGAALFFTGWIYRWAYFAFFQLDITSLDLPAQSFLIVPIQVFLGSLCIIARTALLVILTVIAISVTLCMMQSIEMWVKHKLESRSQSSTVSAPQRRMRLLQVLQSLIKVQVLQQESIRTLRSFLSDVVIVAWLFVILFWTARWQGFNDAWQDAQQQTSSLPVISLITPLEELPLGRKLEDVFADPSLEDFSIIGDKGLFDVLRGKEDTDLTTNPDQPRVWRLLLAHGGWIYLFIALPPNATRDMRPSVVAVQEGGGQVMILSPEPSRP
ncbi:MAG: hypothetical protein MJA27_23530 [Pseudanabaenales cyanobacterium]|nr:hypothetical protein [Pseudanabaenales cyanobacterium]